MTQIRKRQNIHVQCIEKIIFHDLFYSLIVKKKTS